MFLRLRVSKKHKRVFARKGFTLVELLLYVAIVSLMVSTIVYFSITILEARVKNQTIAEVEQQGVQVMQIIAQTVRNSTDINAPAQGTSAATLSMNTYTGSNNPTIFDVSGGVIRMKEGSGSPVPLTNSRVTVSGLTFQNLSRANTPGVIRVQFTITYINNSGRNEYGFSQVFSGSASLR